VADTASFPFDCEEIVKIAQRAGALAMQHWKQGQALEKVWEKSPGQIVSEVDLSVNALLKEHLEALCPEAGWLSEETADDEARLSRKWVWVVDPIDGTKDFVKGLPGWCISIALVEDNEPVFGVLYAPAMDEIWVAEKGKGASVNGRKLIASARQKYAGARIPVDVLPPEIDLSIVPKPNSIALRMAMVADDRADIVVSIRWGYEWDIAAAHLIAREAGASVGDAFGKAVSYNGDTGQAFGVLCTSAGLYDQAIKRVADIALEILERDPRPDH